MSDDDQDIWLEIIKTVKPIKKPAAKEKTQPVIKKKVAVRIAVPDRALPDSPVVQHSPLPQKQVKKLRQQKFPIEARLDLHGMIVTRAHDAVITFMRNAIHNRLRCIEIITGKGDPALGRGELRRSLPIWLEDAEIKRHILHIEPNPLSRGGSFLIMLRRTKSDN